MNLASNGNVVPLRSRSHRSRGQAVPEFALVFIPLVLLLFGIFDFGRAVYAYNTISDAARTGARVAIVNQACDPIRTEAMKQANGVIPLGITAGQVTVSFVSGGGSLDCDSTVSIGDVANVTVTYTYSAVTPLLSALLGDITMSSTTQIAVEFPCVGAGCPRQWVVHQ